MEKNITTSLEVRIANERMLLHAQKAITLIDHDILMIADLHFGKIEHFRKNGIPLPPDAARVGIRKLDKLIEATHNSHIVFLGDLFHSDYNNAWSEFEELLDKWSDKKFTLIVGNHDILNRQFYSKMDTTYAMRINQLVLTHEPMDVMEDDAYNLCGHIHPGVRLKGKGSQSLRLPCFYFGDQVGILPSFGTFTGLHVIKPLKDDRVFVVDKNIVMEVS